MTNHGPSMIALGLASLLACASPEVRPAPTPDAPATPERLSETFAQPPEPDALAAPEPKPEPPKPTPIPEDRKKIIEEYKALALKNDCSRGYPNLSGTWRFVGDTRTPNYSDTLIINGTRFKELISGNPDGKYLSAELEGEVRCVFKNRVLIQIDTVKPEGAYGNFSGDLYPCDLLSDMDPKVDRMLMICYFDWDLRVAAGLEFEFERVETKP